MKHLAANAMTLLIVALVAAAGVVFWGMQKWEAAGPLQTPTRFTVASGASLASASAALEKQGVITNASIFRIGARYKKAATALKAGEYEIPPSASMEEVLGIIVSGKAIQYKVTVAEGLTSWEIVEILKANDLLTGEIEEIPVEGSLAPDTYFFGREENRNAVIRRMQAAQTRILDQAWEERASGLPLDTKLEALTLASIVEKETGVASEQDIVAGVFINRLNRRMRLQSDPTIIYGITNGQGPLGRGIRRSEINKATPYNTYVIDRLPPGPIANPGRDAIQAVLNPAETAAIYFVADGTGGHAFAESLREHNQNVAAWRKIERARQSE